MTSRAAWSVRIAFVALVLIAFVSTPAMAQPAPEARIKIDTDRVVGEVHPHLFGNFAEHLGRCIYGGIYEEGSPLADADGYRKDVMEATRGLGVTLLRWPGGNFVSGYNWKDGIGPRADRPVRPEGAWGALEPNRFGTDEFLRYCERLGVEPYICINAGLGSIEDAREWVEYCNESRDTYWAQQRRKNGRDKPYAVKYWGLGNEIDGPWQLGHKNADDYVKFALESAKAMRRVDPQIKLIASGLEQLRPQRRLDRLEPDDPRANAAGGRLHLAPHLHREPRQRLRELPRRLCGHRPSHRGRRGPDPGRPVWPAGSRPIFIAYDEWNVWYRARGGGEHETGRTASRRSTTSRTRSRWGCSSTPSSATPTPSRWPTSPSW